MGFKYNKQGMALNTSQFLIINKNKFLYKPSICKHVLNAKNLPCPKIKHLVIDILECFYLACIGLCQSHR